jgi:hypothetical protein
MALNEPRPEIPDNFVACLIDISEYCEAKFLKRCGGKVYYSGFYNDAVNTYICSFEPTVFVEVMEIVPEGYPEEEPARTDLWEELNDLRTDDDDGYYGRYDIEQMRKEHPNRFRELGEARGETDEEKQDAVREELQGNPVF